ncbi:GntR family transcriptional regulator [Micromonospora sp. WMMD735]|uniref:GntR family transcriptional regulator n=1 Tax=Micromonospora sp. WMMD735 TaxID=3404130 RepID=UPI003B948FF9
MPTPHYGQPRYRAIAEQIRERIERGLISPGSLLPPESALTAEFQASRGTIRQALAVLRESNVVATEHGRGTYVAGPACTQRSDWGSESELRYRKVPADSELAVLFAVDAGTTLIEGQGITQKNGAVETVVRIYRIPRTES